MNNYSKLEKNILAAAFASVVASTTLVIAPILDDPEGTADYLQDNNFRPIEVGGGVWFGGFDEYVRTRFVAEDQQGQIETGYVGEDILGRKAIHFD